MEAWLVPPMIFLAETMVVTLGTLRIIFIARGNRKLAPVLGFFENLIWLCAMSQIMLNLTSPSYFLAFALGFAFGNWLGMSIEARLALGLVVVRVITPADPRPLVGGLREANFGVTCVPGEGASGPVQIVMTMIKRKQLPIVKAIIETHQPSAFYSVDELQTTTEGIFPAQEPRAPAFWPAALKRLLPRRADALLARRK
ncbi:MAG: DUF5698 domain-containing protein [Gemmataceae bacterium]